MDINNQIDLIYDDLVEIRRDLHMHPELGENEFRTGDKICEILDSCGIEYERGIADTGIVGIIRGKHDGITVGARADIDALPIQEIRDIPYKSQNNGVMHACGHDVHTTILLGVAKILKQMEDELHGNVKLFFQPAEESIGGGQRMVEQGCMENPPVKYVTGLHVQAYLEAGQVELKYGKLNGSTDEIVITVHGKSGHGAYPQNTVDAIVIAGHIITSLQTIVSRNVSPLNSAVISLGTINGGTKNNIITGEVTLTGTLRTLDPETRAFCKQRIKEVVMNTAASFGGSADVMIEDGYSALINDGDVVSVIEEVAIEELGKENVFYKEFPSLGGEDFSYFCEAAKGGFYHLGCGNKSKGITAGIHNEYFDVDESCIKTGVLLQVKSLLKLLEK